MKIVRISTVPISLNLLLKGQLKFLSQYFNVIGISSKGKYLNDVEKREGIRTIAIDMKRNIAPCKDIISLIKLYKVLKKEKPLIVHSMTPKAGLLGILAAKMARVPIRMHTFTGLIFPSKSGILQYILIQMDKLLCRCATNIYPEGKGVKNDLINYKITSKPLKIIANGNVNGIDIVFFDTNIISDIEKNILRNELGLEKDDFAFVFVGRLVGDKGINELIKAFNNISKYYERVKLLLVGPQEPDLDPLDEETLETISQNSNIIEVGYQSDVRPYFSVSNTLVFPSYREGFPNVVMQAGAMGLPSIVTDINGCNEIIIEGENGTIIPAKDTIALQKKMELFITDRALIEKLRSKAREMIASRYEQKMVWEALLEEYKSLLKKAAYV
jgi:glycosyltransferase involved in cell wall biosynthesis